MTFANNLDPDEAPQNVGLHLRSKLFDIKIIYQQKNGWKQWFFLKILKETNILKNYPACKELKTLELPCTPTLLRARRLAAYISRPLMEMLMLMLTLMPLAPAVRLALPSLRATVLLHTLHGVDFECGAVATTYSQMFKAIRLATVLKIWKLKK